MKKEIGSIFPLSDEAITMAESVHLSYSGNRLFYSLCREALYDIAISVQTSNKTVLIPAYTCQTVITPFEEAGWKCQFFSIQKDLRINVPKLFEIVSREKPSLLVVHPYFGMDLNAEEVSALQFLKEKGIKIVVDLTQCLFSTKCYPFADFKVASYRKWMPIPDGGFLECDSDSLSILQPETENIRFTEIMTAAMFLRYQYFENGLLRIKGISIKLSKEANLVTKNDIMPHKMSSVSYSLMQMEDLEGNQKRRISNYAYLSTNIHESEKIIKVCQNLSEVTTAPLYFTIYVKNRSSLQGLLAKEAIYAPVIWPVEDLVVLIDENIRYIYDHLLAIPCDQRYDQYDMQRAVTIINNF